MFPKIVFALIAMFTVSLQAQVTVANGASFRTEQPVAAGSWAVATGNFAGVSTVTASAFPLPTSLGNVRVSVGGVEAPLYYVSATQINFLIPQATTTGVKAVSVITASGNIEGTVQVINAAPGLFVDFGDAANTPISGRVLNAEQGLSVNTPSNPALRGQIIAIFGTGPGAFDREVSDGATPGLPLANTVSTPQVFLGGIEAEVTFSGLNPDAPGLWQINATIPADLPITGRVPLVVYSDGVDSNEVSIFVQ